MTRDFNKDGQVLFGQKIINFKVKRNPRRKRTIGLCIEPNGDVLIISPINTPEWRLNQLVISKGEWIIKKLNSIANNPLPKEKKFVSGETFLFLGKKLNLRIIPNINLEKTNVTLNGDFIDVLTDKTDKIDYPFIKDSLVNWYKMAAFKIITERVKYYADKMAINEPQVLIRNQKKRWGSCSTKGILRINWKIIMSPINLIDYLVVHELCHLRHMNHSDKFWKYLNSIMPDYQEREKDLKEMGKEFQI